jgi:hypothetical protein
MRTIWGLLRHWNLSATMICTHVLSEGARTRQYAPAIIDRRHTQCQMHQAKRR